MKHNPKQRPCVTGMCPLQLYRAPSSCSAGSVLGSVLCFHHLEILINFNFKLVFYQWSPRAKGVCAGIKEAGAICTSAIPCTLEHRVLVNPWNKGIQWDWKWIVPGECVRHLGLAEQSHWQPRRPCFPGKPELALHEMATQGSHPILLNSVTFYLC